eukprot:TRINITY_DN23204_c0_g1_i3.p2 TRINITY_DN23204_c0_g1~~TRINITY_DN23204_c0_g1_i3.p2  ORF type:complete len:256 (-),score=83.83 TRINITY_DN23204_c0_g1_i3:583-1350(-)
MDLGLATRRPAPAADKQPQAKKGKQAAAETQQTGQDAGELQGLTLQMAKLLLATSSDVRHIKTILTVNVLFDKESELGAKVAATAKQVMGDYMAQTKAMQVEERGAFGPPTCFVWQGLISVIMQAGKELQAMNDPRAAKLEHALAKIQEHNTAIEKHTQQLVVTENMDPKAAARAAVTAAVKVCRVCKCYNPKMMRLELAPAMQCKLTGDTLNAIGKVMETAAGGQVKQGAAPKSDAERRIEKALNKSAGATKQG